MFAVKTLLALFAAAAAVSARVVPRTSPPAGWWTEGLEDYTTYHTRYLALGCQNNHGTAFFDACCHPLKSDETLESARAPECIPSASASASASLAEPTSTVTTPDDESSASASASATVTAVISGSDSSASLSTSSSPSASATPAVNIATDGGDADDEDTEDDDDDCEADDEDDGNDGEDGDTDDDEDCEDGGDDGTISVSSVSSTAVPTSASLSESTAAPSPTFTEAASSSSSIFTAAPSSESVPSESKSSSSFSKASSTEASSATTPSSESSSGGDVVTGGFATFFYQNGNAGACGQKHSDSDFIGAIDSHRYGDTSKQSDLCGKQVKITNTNNNKSVVITLADACPTCDNENCIDLSTGAFDQIADESVGQVPIDWQFV